MLSFRFILSFFVAFIVLHSSTWAQTLYALQGYVYDEESGVPLPGATVYVKSASAGTNTNELGYYELQLAEGRHYIIYSFVGYQTDSINIALQSNTTYDFRLKALATLMKEITVSSEQEDKNITQTEIGLITIKKEEIERLPYLLGEIDPIRMIQLMPGVQSSAEGNTGFFVRGGAVDQNLILLDNSIVYNPSHLFGFFSIFHSSAINSIDLYKGGIPSDYGGRLSSITKINTRKGDAEQFRGEGSVGLVATNVLVEGPIKKNKGSFLIAGRRTYIDLFIDPLRDLFSVEEKIDYYFYDLNLNIHYNVSPKHILTLKSYQGKDDFAFGTGSGFSNLIKWGNRTASINWMHTISNNLHGELSVNTTSYNMDFTASINPYNFNILSDIKDTGISYRVDHIQNKHNLSYGLNYTRHTLKPNHINAYSEDVKLDFNTNVNLNAEEGAVFINDKIHLSDKIELNAGVRFTGFNQLGPFTRYMEDDNFQILDTISYRKNTSIKTYYNFEPRVALRYSFNSVSSLKLSYDKSYQYMHMAPLSSASLPLDVWVPSSTIVKPQSASQYSAGYFRNFQKNKIESSVVLYYKSMQNQIEYRDGVIIGYSKGFNYDDNFVFGKGSSYGMEYFIKKNVGKVNGSIAYTLSRTTRQFKDLNKGKPFPAKYDRLHDLSVLANYEHSGRWTFSGVFVYGTGNALNLPVARYVIQGNVVNEYGERNSFRMPPYHRLDLAATYATRKSKRFESYWIFSVYNVYSRRNPYYIYFETEGNLAEYKLKTSLKQVSLFPVIPSVTYRLKF